MTDVVPRVAVMVTLVLVVTVAGLNVNVPVLAPAAIVTDAGTGTAVPFELLSVIVTPAGPAGPERVTVPVTAVVPFPVNDVVERVRLDSVAAVTVSAAVFETLAVPVIVTDALELTAKLVSVAVAVVLPAATVTDPAVKFAAVVTLEARVTTVPDGPAGALRVTVTVGFVTPPTTELAESETALRIAGLIVNVAVAFAVPTVAVIVAVVVALTAAAVKVKVPDVFPAAIVIEEAERVVDVLDVERATVVPDEGAGPVKVTVPVMAEVRPP